MMTLKWILPSLALALAVVVAQAQPEGGEGGQPPLPEKPRPTEPENPAPVEPENPGPVEPIRQARQAPGGEGGAGAPGNPPPSPPPDFKKIENPFESATDADLPAPRTRGRARTSSSRRPSLRPGAKGEQEQESVRGLLAEYRKRAAERHARRGNRTSIPEEMKRQHRARLAEQKAHNYVAPLTIPEINAALSDDLYDGDILLSKEQAQALVDDVLDEGPGGPGGPGYPGGPGNATQKRVKRGMLNFATYPGNKWPLYPAQIPYAFDSTVDASRKAQIMKGISYYYDNTCFDFIETTTTDTSKSLPIIIFTQGAGCFSSLGKSGGAGSTQTLSIGSGCERIGTVLHEIYHALGAFHTQARFDRDSFVTVDNTKIQDASESQYIKQTSSSNNNQGVKYDYGSAMHYSANSFADNSNVPGMTALEANMMQTMGQREALAFSDVVMLNKAYGCGACSASDISRCQNGGIPNPNWCDQCICPKGFEGTSCTTRQSPTSNAKSSPGGSACGGTFTSTTDWQQISGTLNSGVSSSAYSPFESCHYHFTAPAGKTVWVWVNSISSNACSIGCPEASVEVKYNDFTRAGHRLCCQSDLGSAGYIQVGGYSNTLVVSIVSKGPVQSFGLYYIYV